MSRALSACLMVFACSGGFAQTLEDKLNFEAPQTGACPNGWKCNPPEAIALDDKIVHSGKWSVRIARSRESAGEFSTIITSIPVDFDGKNIELRGFIRSQDVSGFAAFWLREDSSSGAAEFATMQGKNPVVGTVDWGEHSISAPINPEAQELVFGFLQSGPGTSWADDLSLWVDGKPLAQAPKRPVVHTVLDTDREFDKGSGVELKSVSPVQIDNLTALCKVWGFVKYHHPAIVSGQRQFDYEFFRVLPAVLAAPDRAAANAAMVKWIAGLPAVTPCQTCAQLKKTDLYMTPDLAWLRDTKLLGADLSRTLLHVYENRATAKTQFYVSFEPGVGNPVFEHELNYSGIKFPDSGFQLLALFRFWNIVEYWYPYRDLIGGEWDRILPEFIAKIAVMRDSQDYQLQMMQIIARVQDGHANLWSSLSLRPPGGECAVPAQIRFLDNQPVVSQVPRSDTGLKVGDIVQEIDGNTVSTSVAKWTPYYGDSNRPSVLRDIGESMTRGSCAPPAAMTVLRNGNTISLTVNRLPLKDETFAPLTRHDRPGPAFQKLSDEIAYLKLSAVTKQDAMNYVNMAAGTKGLVIDIRNYLSAFSVFTIGNHLVDKSSAFAAFTGGSAVNPGAFSWEGTASLEPEEPRYKGKVAILVDETSQSQSEYTAMAFRTAPQAAVVGSTTGGADGNISPIPLPGGFSTMISGIGIFYPDHKPTQRVGIVPDIQVTPTLEGIRAGRDEVVEAAVRYIKGQ